LAGALQLGDLRLGLNDALVDAGDDVGGGHDRRW
jgi:hypothetical protein